MFKPCSNQIFIKVNYIGRSPGLPATVFKPYLVTEIGRRQGLLEAINNQIKCVQTCVCVYVGRGTCLPETMFKQCLMDEIGRGPSLLEAVINQLRCVQTCAVSYTHLTLPTTPYV